MQRRANNLVATRRTLLSRLRNWEDQDSWQEFFDIYWRLIYSFASNSGLSGTEAEEVVQETMLAVAKQMPGFRYDPNIGSFKSWLLHTTQWKIRDQIRKRQRLNRVVDRVQEEHSNQTENNTADNGHDSKWDLEWDTRLLEAAIERTRKKVGAQQFQIFQLYALDGWSVKEVTRQLGINRSQVYVAKYRVQHRIKEEIEHLETNMV